MCLYIIRSIYHFIVFVSLPFVYRSMIWMKHRLPLSCDHPNSHRTALLYVSDMLGLSYRWKYPNLQLSAAASLDHAVWFHAHVRADQWHLMVAECEHDSGGRAIIGCRYVSHYSYIGRV